MSSGPFLEIFFLTLGVPWLVVCVLVTLWFLKGGPSRIDYAGLWIALAWCTAVALGVNFLYLDVPFRIALFSVISLAGVGCGRLLDVVTKG